MADEDEGGRHCGDLGSMLAVGRCEVLRVIATSVLFVGPGGWGMEI